MSGSTNPPPEKWFFACKLWKGKCGSEGLNVTVPQGAQQVLLFLAPHTGGDLRTLIGAVRGRPGAFVRTSQDLNQAALDRSRLERFLAAVRVLNEGDPSKLKDAAPLLARSLAIKVEDKCLDRIPELQAPCLMQGQESLILNDGHSTSIVEALDLWPRQRSGDGGELYAATELRLLQPLHLHRCWTSRVSWTPSAPRNINTFLHLSSPRGRQDCAHPERGSLVPQPHVGAGHRPAGGGIAAASAAARGRS